MKERHFTAVCSAEIGDKFRDTNGASHTITDIAAVHYVSSGKVEFLFELDSSGNFVQIDIPQRPKTKIGNITIS